MNPVLVTGAAVLTLATLLALVHVPLGTWIHRVYTDEQDWRVERAGLSRGSASVVRAGQRACRWSPVVSVHGHRPVPERHPGAAVAAG